MIYIKEVVVCEKGPDIYFWSNELGVLVLFQNCADMFPVGFLIGLGTSVLGETSNRNTDKNKSHLFRSSQFEQSLKGSIFDGIWSELRLQIGVSLWVEKASLASAPDVAAGFF